MTDAMQFCSYVFPHNPAEIRVTRAAQTVPLFCPGVGEVVQNLGVGARTVHCSGSFFGASAEEAAARLEEFLTQAGPGREGMLFLPGWMRFRACLRDCVYKAAGDGKVIPYSLVFVECGVEA